jgi:hypothetical protein
MADFVIIGNFGSKHPSTMHPRPRRNVTAPRRPDDPFSFAEVLRRQSPQSEQGNSPAPLNIDTPIPSTDMPTAGAILILTDLLC